jgi:hypothetical protein
MDGKHAKDSPERALLVKGMEALASMMPQQAGQLNSSETTPARRLVR